MGLTLATLLVVGGCGRRHVSVSSAVDRHESTPREVAPLEVAPPDGAVSLVAIQGHNRILYLPMAIVVRAPDEELRIQLPMMRGGEDIRLPATGEAILGGQLVEGVLRHKLTESIFESPYEGPWRVHDRPGVAVPWPDGFDLVTHETHGAGEARVLFMKSTMHVPVLQVQGPNNASFDLDALARGGGLLEDHRQEPIPWVEVVASAGRRTVFAREVGGETYHVVCDHRAPQAAEVRAVARWMAENLVETTGTLIAR